MTGCEDDKSLPLVVTTRSPAAAAAIEQAVFGWCAHRADTAVALKTALAADPDLVVGRVLEGFAARLLGRRDLLAGARIALNQAERSLAERGGSATERRFATALSRSIAGDPLGAIAELEAITRAEPANVLAVKLDHALRFVIGDSAGMRRALERVLSAYGKSTPGRALVLGCYAFSLVETGELEEGERIGRAAVEAEPLDAWGFHAVMHALLMQGKNDAGLVWARSRGDRYRGCTNFAGHIAWHEALFHVARADYERALELHDREIAVYPARDYRDIANATSLLYRLTREGVAVGDRWEAHADAARERFGDHESAFADAHYALALAGAGRLTAAKRFVASMRVETSMRAGFEAAVAREAGIAVAEGIVALAAGDPERALERFASVASEIRRLGGSEAQRDLFEELAADAALASSRLEAARAIARGRLRRRPADRWALRIASIERRKRAAGER